MKMQQVYKLGFFALILLNAVVLYVLISPPPHPRGFPPRQGQGKHPLMEKICQHLSFDDQQKTQFYQLADAHRDQMNQLNQEKNEFLQAYFALLNDNAQAETAQPILSQQITTLEAKKLGITYAHLADVRQLCTKDQQKLFPEIVKMVMNAILNDSPKTNHRPPRDE